MIGSKPPGAEATMARLRGRLLDGAEREGLVDVGYRTLDSPLGPLLLAATEQGLVRIAFQVQGFDTVLESLAAHLSPRVLASPRRLDPVATQLEEFFAGRRRRFELRLDRALSAGFRGEVHRHLPAIGFGDTTSYGQVAAALGRPRAVRAVGTACATNPLPLVVPCHRVLRADGSTGAYAGGPAAKQTLLDLERHGRDNAV